VTVTALQPTAADLAEYAKVDPGEALLVEAMGAALDQQCERCVVVPYTASLRLAALRRGARYLAGRNVPLGIVVGEFGSDRLARWDALTDELEATRLRVVVA
jgi:hypothetical protein